jgi:hypothetical protein
MSLARGGPSVLRLLTSVALFALSACRGPEQPFEPLAPRVANLKAQFNQDASKVRILILPAPT